MHIKDEILYLMSSIDYKPMSYEELFHALDVEESLLTTVKKTLRLMEKDKIITRNKEDKYTIFKKKKSIVTGKLNMTSKGYGFLIPDDKSEDVFIPPGNFRGAINGDRVEVNLVSSSKDKRRREGEVVKILERGNDIFVGTYQDNKRFGFVVPDDKKMPYDIFISGDDKKNAKKGNVVLVKLTKWPKEDKNPEGKILEVIGNRGEKGVDIKLIIKKYNLPEEFPPKTLKFANNIETSVSEDSLKGRLDLRDERIITIDGIDAKDLDDAIMVERLPNGNFRLGVHIADVSNYVKENSSLDKEAFKRGTSVYLIDYVIPMLPQSLSNGICSLNPGVDRLTLSCIMEIDSKGKTLNYDIKESVIRSKARMTYEDVSKILKGDEELSKKYNDLIEDFKIMEELCLILYKKRIKRGAIDFDLKECKIELDEDGKPIKIEPYDRDISNRIIEEFMLCANETIAEHFYWAKIPFVYRIHEDPDEEKLERFSNFINNLGYNINQRGDSIHPKSLQKILSLVKNKNEEKVVNTLLLRSLKQARYASECIGHFGLSAKYYCHFTSPIRRYPDLMIHRIIKEFINSRINEKKQEMFEMAVENASIQSSITERKAEEAERELDNIKKAEYMSERIGEVYDGIISSVTGFGFFVELYNTIEGLIPIDSIGPDFYYYDEENLALRGTYGDEVFKLGDKIKVEVSRVNIPTHEIYFDIFRKRKDGFNIVDTNEVLI